MFQKDFAERSQTLELLDLGPSYYANEEYEDCLKKLGHIGRYLGGNAATFKAFKNLKTSPKSILDFGCGGGDFTKCLAEKYPNSQVVGIDTSEKAIAYAKQNMKKLSNLSFRHCTSHALTEAPKSFDVITTTLVCHHLSDRQLVEFLKKAVLVARKAVIINDLHRHPAAYYLFLTIAPVFFRNRLVRHDGPLSIKRSFTRKDWQEFLALANIKPDRWKLTWNLFYRWVLTINASNI